MSNLKYNVPLKIWERGMDYYHNGAVTDLKEHFKDNWIATVEGSDAYTVEVTLKGDEIESWDCDCPYDMGDICKHVVAVLLAIREEKENAVVDITPFNGTIIVEKDVPSIPFEDIMKLAKEEDLRTFMENYSLNDNAFKHAFVDFITKKYIKPEKKEQKDYIKEISNIFSSTTGNGKSRYSYRYDYDDDSDWMSIACDMQKLFDEAEIMLKAGDFVTPIIIVMNFFKTASECADDCVYYDDEGQYEMRECCEKAGELIMKIVSNPSVDIRQKQEIFRDICKIEEDDIIFSYFEYDVEDLMFEIGALLQSPEERITMLDDKIKEQEEKGYRVYKAWNGGRLVGDEVEYI